VFAGAALVVLVVLAGCGGGNEGQVSGVVKVDGEPLKSGKIAFFPVDPKTGGTAGGDIENGRYSVRVPITRMKVSISQSKVVGKKKLYNTPNSQEQDVTAEALPARYNEKTELEYDVKPGSQEKNFDLKSK